MVVIWFALGYIFISALVIFNVEPETFGSFFDAVYWATVSLTTMGYGDIYPVSTIGRIVTMLSSFIGIAIVALPAGILTAGYMEELEEKLVELKNAEGPILLQVCVKKGNRKDLGRPTTTPIQNKEALMAFLSK